MGCNTSQEKPAATPQVDDDQAAAEAAAETAAEGVATTTTDAAAATADAVNGASVVAATASNGSAAALSSSPTAAASAGGKATDVAPLAAPDASNAGDEDSGPDSVSPAAVTPLPAIGAANCNGSAKPDDATTTTTTVTENGVDGGALILNGEVMGKAEEDAAVKIQAVFRGHKVRTDMKQGDADTDGASASKDGGAAAANNGSEPTRQELEAEFREDDKELCNAATRIQATFRGHLSRKLATEGTSVLKDEKDLQEITKKVAEELDIDMNDPELHKAATKIQASFRGHKARRDVDGPEAN